MRQILFKDPMMQREFAQLHPKLYEIIEYMDVQAALYDDFLVCTSIYRSDSSTHSNPKPYRFIDFAILERGGESGSETIRGLVNKTFQYDPNRPGMETIPKLDHGTGAHFHIQVLA